MNRRALLAAAISHPIALLVQKPAEAHGYRTRTIEISHPWTFEQDIGAGATAIVGMVIRNRGKQPDRLIKAETGDAGQAALVTAAAAAGSGGPGIALPPGSSITLHAAGPHILLNSVRKPLFAYNNLFVTLVFARAGRIRIEVPVEERLGDAGAYN